MSAAPLNERFARLWRAFDARSRREQLLLIGASLAVLWLVADAVWLTPTFKQWSQARARETQAATTLQALQADVTQRGNEARAAEQQLKTELAALRERVAKADADLREAGASLVNAREIVPVLDRLLAQSGALRLRSMQSIGRNPVGVVSAASASAGAAQAPQGAALYRHGVELTVEGSYADLLAYVRAIEALPQRVLWGGMELKVEQYPKVLLTLRLFTLSQDREWLEI